MLIARWRSNVLVAHIVVQTVCAFVCIREQIWNSCVETVDHQNEDAHADLMLPALLVVWDWGGCPGGHPRHELLASLALVASLAYSYSVGRLEKETYLGGGWSANQTQPTGRLKCIC
jgi:hypothetical protein